MTPKDAYTALVGLSMAMLLVPASIVLMVSIEEEGFRWTLQVALVGSLLLAVIGVFGSRHRFFLLGAGMVTVLTVVVLAIDGGFGVLVLQLVFLSCILGTLLGARLVRTKRYLVPEGDVWPEVDEEVVDGMWRMALDHGLRVGAAFLLALMLHSGLFAVQPRQRAVAAGGGSDSGRGHFTVHRIAGVGPVRKLDYRERVFLEPMDCDVAIVGGGPAGCLTAANLPRSLRTLIFEEHERTGVPTQCAGLVTERVVRSVGAEGTMLNRIDGAVHPFP